MDDLLLSRIRLEIVSQLLSAQWVAFSDLRQLTKTTGGNLGAHLGKLVDAGYVAEEKSFVNRRPQTRYRLRQKGRAAFVQHVRDMQALLEGTLQAGSSP